MSEGKRLPEVLRLRCYLGSAPFAGAWVFVTLETSYKNPLNFAFGPANEKGELEIARSLLLEEGQKNRDLFLMDYGHPEASWTGRIKIKIPNESDIMRAIYAYDLWGEAGGYPPSFKEKLIAMAEVLKQHSHDRLSIEVVVIPEGAATVEVLEQMAA